MKLGCWVLAFLICISGLNLGVHAAEQTGFAIGYLEISEDARYDDKRAYARIRVKHHYRPYAGAQLALRNSRILGRALNIKFDLKYHQSENPKALIADIRRLYEQEGVGFFVIDADGDALGKIAAATAAMDILLFNVSASDDSLRGVMCQAHLLHTLPSTAMLSDGLSQYLVSKNWRTALLLTGPDAEDKKFAEAFIKSAKKFGVKIEQTRPFILGNDPRQRARNNVVLLTSNVDVDVIVVADVEGEFGRYVPYQSQKPHLVVGTEGLQVSAWHWAWERHGAPQLNQRFEKHAKRRMQSTDWAAWVAVRSIVEAVVRTKSTEFQVVLSYLLSDRLTLDTYKGTPANYRSWDHQLRQPVLLHTHNSIVERAPISGFLHPIENMDTLGAGMNDTKCQLKK